MLLYNLFPTVLAKSLGGVALYSFFNDIETKVLRSDPSIPSTSVLWLQDHTFCPLSLHLQISVLEFFGGGHGE